MRYPSMPETSKEAALGWERRPVWVKSGHRARIAIRRLLTGGFNRSAQHLL